MAYDDEQPTQEQIQRRAARIRDSWSILQEARRRGVEDATTLDRKTGHVKMEIPVVASEAILEVAKQFRRNPDW